MVSLCRIWHTTLNCDRQPFPLRAVLRCIFSSFMLVLVKKNGAVALLYRPPVRHGSWPRHRLKVVLRNFPLRHENYADLDKTRLRCFKFVLKYQVRWKA